MFLLYQYRSRKSEVDDEKDEKNVRDYIVLTSYQKEKWRREVQNK